MSYSLDIYNRKLKPTKDFISFAAFVSVLGEHWTEVFAEINNGIKNYMDKNGYSKMSEMIGNAKRS